MFNARPSPLWVRRGFAWAMAHAGGAMERTYGEFKNALFTDLHGVVLEIGPGAGANLRHYPRNAIPFGVEPNPYMAPHLRREAHRRGIALRLIAAEAEHLPFRDGSMDAVVSTLVLCSVADPSAALAEVRRVLKPSGRFLFIEHVAAPPGTLLRRLQRAVAPAWSFAGDGCRPDRDTAGLLHQAGFGELRYETVRVGTPLNLTRPHIVGEARKAQG